MKKFIIFSWFVIVIYPAKAQWCDMETGNGQTISSCVLDFNDNVNGDYAANVVQTITLKSNSSINTHLKLTFSSFDIDPSDTLYIYNGLYVTDSLIGKYNNSHPLSGIQNIIQSTIRNVSGAITFKFVTNGSNQKSGWHASLSCIQPCQRLIASLNPTSTSPMPENNYINVCFGNPVIFFASVNFPDNDLSYNQTKLNSSFQWDFGDNSAIAYGHTVSHNYTSPIGYSVKLKITDSMGCVSTNDLGTRVRIASMPVSSIQSLEDMCTDDTKLLSAGYNPNSVVLMEPSGVKTLKQIYDSIMFIPDGPACPPGVSTSSILFNNFPAEASIQSANDILAICINIEHSFSGDLGFKISCPGGQNVILDPNSHSGGAYIGEPYGGNYHGIYDNGCLPSNNISGIGWTYCWSELYPNNYTTFDYLSSSTGTGTILVNGNRTIDSTNQTMHLNYIKPQNPLSGLVGCPLNGIWTIEITDDYAIDNGYLFNWSIELQNSLQSGGWSYNVKVDSVVFSGPFLTQLTDSTAVIAPLNAGNYTYNITMFDQLGCVWDTITTMEVISTPHPDLFNDISLCYPNTVVLNPGNIATFYSWHTPSGIKTTQSITTEANYNIVNSSFYYVLTASNSNTINTLSCSGKDSLLVTVKPLPEIAFSLSPAIFPFEGCSPLTATFTNETTPQNSAFEWNFGDGQYSVQVSPTHDYMEGNYAISLTATTQEGCTKTWYSPLNFIVSIPSPPTPFITQNGFTLVSSAVNGNQWYNVNTGIVNGATSQNFIPTIIGDYYTIVTINGCSSSNSNNIYISNVGINEQFIDSLEIQILPNPFSDKTTIIYTLTHEEKVELSIYTVMGLEIAKPVDEKQPKGKQIIILDASNLSTGIYFYRLKAGNETKTGKIILER